MELFPSIWYCIEVLFHLLVFPALNLIHIMNCYSTNSNRFIFAFRHTFRMQSLTSWSWVTHTSFFQVMAWSLYGAYIAQVTSWTNVDFLPVDPSGSLNKNTIFFIQENASKHIVFKMAAILSGLQCFINRHLYFRVCIIIVFGKVVAGSIWSQPKYSHYFGTINGNHRLAPNQCQTS